MRLIVTHPSKRTSWIKDQKLKIVSLLFPKWLFFQLNYGVIFFWNRTLHLISRYGYHWWHQNVNKTLILSERLLKLENLGKVLQFKSPFLHENAVFSSNPSSNLKSISIEDSEVCENLKIDLGTIFLRYCDIIQPCNSKSSLRDELLYIIYLLVKLTDAPASDAGRAGRSVCCGVGPGGGGDTAWTFSKPGMDAI